MPNRDHNFTVQRHWADESMDEASASEAEALLAELLAEAYAAEHPELFPSAARPGLTSEASGRSRDEAVTDQ